MSGTPPREAAPSDPAPPDLAPQLERLHGNLTLLARVIVQLDRRLKRLEETHQASGSTRLPKGRRNRRSEA